MLVRVATGSSNRDAAAVLHISEATVRRHLANIYRQAGRRLAYGGSGMGARARARWPRSRLTLVGDVHHSDHVRRRRTSVPVDAGGYPRAPSVTVTWGNRPAVTEEKR